MNPDDALIQTAIDALIITLKIMAPILAAGIVVGLVISILQSITSIQEQTICSHDLRDGAGGGRAHPVDRGAADRVHAGDVHVVVAGPTPAVRGAGRDGWKGRWPDWKRCTTTPGRS